MMDAVNRNACLLLIVRGGACQEFAMSWWSDEETDWSDEETDNPLRADDRNFYTVEKWT